MNNVELADPASLSPRDRAAEVTAILAIAIVRTLCPDVPETTQVDLGFVPDQRVHTTPSQQES